MSNFDLATFEKEEILLRAEDTSLLAIITTLVTKGLDAYELTPRLEKELVRIKKLREKAVDEDSACWYEDQLTAFAGKIAKAGIADRDDAKPVADKPAAKSKVKMNLWTGEVSNDGVVKDIVDEDLKMDSRYKNGHTVKDGLTRI